MVQEVAARRLEPALKAARLPLARVSQVQARVLRRELRPAEQRASEQAQELVRPELRLEPEARS